MPKFLRSILSHFGTVAGTPKEPVFVVRIVYKSGYTHDFEVTSFSIKNGTSFQWTMTGDTNRPVLIGADEIAAVWQLGVK